MPFEVFYQEWIHIYEDFLELSSKLQVDFLTEVEQFFSEIQSNESTLELSLDNLKNNGHNNIYNNTNKNTKKNKKKKKRVV